MSKEKRGEVKKKQYVGGGREGAGLLQRRSPGGADGGAGAG